MLRVCQTFDVDIVGAAGQPYEAAMTVWSAVLV